MGGKTLKGHFSKKEKTVERKTVFEYNKRI
jgi:hypothetical protein